MATEVAALVPAENRSTDSPPADGEEPLQLYDNTMKLYVERGFRNSDPRTPIIVVADDGDALPTVERLAKAGGSTVWPITTDCPRSTQNAIDYVEVGVHNGDWVFLRQAELADPDTMRRVAMMLATLKPDPKNAPRREQFRLWIEVSKPFHTDDRDPPLPPLLIKAAFLARPGRIPGSKHGAPGSSPNKLQKRQPADPALWEGTQARRSHRREAGRDESDESDADEPPAGRWFDRARDFYETDGGTTVGRVSELIFDAVEQEDLAALLEMAESGRVDIAKVKRAGMTPLQYAVSIEKVDAARVLIHAGADVHQRREADGSPLLFMCIERGDLLALLVEAGCDYDERFEGQLLENHALTPPATVKLIREIKAADARAAEEGRANPVTAALPQPMDPQPEPTEAPESLPAPHADAAEAPALEDESPAPL